MHPRVERFNTGMREILEVRSCSCGVVRRADRVFRASAVLIDDPAPELTTAARAPRMTDSSSNEQHFEKAEAGWLRPYLQRILDGERVTEAELIAHFVSPHDCEPDFFDSRHT
jgi:hypothetical protein